MPFPDINAYVSQYGLLDGLMLYQMACETWAFKAWLVPSDKAK